MDVINSITGLAESYALFLIPIVLGVTQLIKNYLPDNLSGKLAPAISVVLSMGATLLLIGLTKQAAIIGLIIGLTSSGLYSGGKALAAKTGNLTDRGGHARIPVLVLLVLLCIFAISFIGCASMGPEVPLTQEQTNIVNVQTYEDSFMNIFRSAKAYVLQHPEYTDRWNNTIQPLFSLAHKALAVKERQLLGSNTTAAQVQGIVDDVAREAITAMVAIGWIKPATGGK